MILVPVACELSELSQYVKGTMQQFSNLQCSSEFHLSKLNSKYSPLIYSTGYRLSKKSGKFFCSALSLAGYFGCHRNTIYAGLKELTSSGFFQILYKQTFDVTIYAVLSHTEWANLHPNECAEKLEFPWSPEDDALGKQLYAASGGKIKLLPHHPKLLRKTGLTDEQIVSRFDGLLADSGDYRVSIPYFIKVLRSEAA